MAKRAEDRRCLVQSPKNQQHPKDLTQWLPHGQTQPNIWVSRQDVQATRTVKATKIRGTLLAALHPKCPTQTQLSLYTQLYIRFVISYVGQAWGTLIVRQNWNRLEAVQNRNLRLILKAPFYVSNKNILSATNLPTTQELILRNSRTLFFETSV